MILKIKYLTSILIFLSGFYFFFIGYQNIIIEKIKDQNISTESEANQNSNIINEFGFFIGLPIKKITSATLNRLVKVFEKSL